MPDWLQWHEGYATAGSPQSQRLPVVVRRLTKALSLVASPSPRLLSLCAGDGRDVISALADGPDRPVAATLVEKDDVLAGRARMAANAARLTGLQVRCADAGTIASFADVLPVDVLMLCGIFGNIQLESVRHVVDTVPRLVRSGGFVIWTKGGRPPDRRPDVRGWFAAAGMAEVAFDGAPAPFGVGLNHVGQDLPLPSGEALTEPLFSFCTRR